MIFYHYINFIVEPPPPGGQKIRINQGARTLMLLRDLYLFIIGAQVSFSPDGTMVAGGTTEGGIVVWNVGTGIRTLTSFKKINFTRIFIFSNGGAGGIQSSLAPVGDTGGHTAVGISSVDWSVAGLLSADRSGSVVQWRS